MQNQPSQSTGKMNGLRLPLTVPRSFTARQTKKGRAAICCPSLFTLFYLISNQRANRVIGCHTNTTWTSTM